MDHAQRISILAAASSNITNSGSLKPGVSSFQQNDTRSESFDYDNQKKRNTLQFNMVSVSEDEEFTDDSISALVDSGAPYRCKEHHSLLMHQWNHP